MSTQRVLVTGALGNVGGATVKAITSRGLAVRIADRTVERARAIHGANADVALLDFTRPESFKAAVEGCDGLFLVRPPAIANVRDTLIPLIDVARAAGVRHVVFLSVAGAEKNALVPHHAVETYLKATGSDWTLLRPGFFAQNLGDAYRADIAADNRIYVPAGRGLVNFVDVRDLADVAALAFSDPERHCAKAWTLCGAGPLSLDAVAAVLTEELGRQIAYKPASIVGYARHLKRRAMPWGQIAVQTILHVGLRFGQGASEDPTLSSLLGRPPRPLREYIRDHADLWRPAAR